MSKNKTTKKKVVVTTTSTTTEKSKNQVSTKKSGQKVKPVSKRRASARTPEKQPLTFGKDNYLLMGIGFGLVIVGLFLMSGGNMPSPDIWDENIIYSFRRTVLAPIIILAGLVVEIFAIFKGYQQ